jgi:hypothetical protein
MSDATVGTGESCLGRVWVLLTLMVLFVTPLWVMITAGLMQVFPEFMGLEIVVDDQGTRRAVTLYSMAVAGTLSAGLVAGFLGVITVFGGTSWAVGRVQAVRERSAAQRFEDIAGDAVMAGMPLKTTTRPSGDDGSDGPRAKPSPQDRSPVVADGPLAAIVFLEPSDPEPLELLRLLAQDESPAVRRLAARVPREGMTERLDRLVADADAVEVELRGLAVSLGADGDADDQGDFVRRHFVRWVTLALSTRGPLDEEARDRVDALVEVLTRPA